MAHTVTTVTATDIAPAALRESDAARYLSVTTSYLRAARVGRCDGPTYVRIGRAVTYLRADLDAWLAARRVGQPRDAA
jgi:hypothetical protein